MKGNSYVKSLLMVGVILFSIVAVYAIGVSCCDSAIRLSDGTLFDESYYLATYPDVAAALKGGSADFTSAAEHYLKYGKMEGRKAIASAADVSPATVISSSNAYRAASGLSGLTEDASLDAIAQTRANELASMQKTCHERPDGSKWSTAFAGHASTLRGENAASDGKNPSSTHIVDLWMASVSHKANIMNPSFTKTGCAIAYGNDGRIYWVQVFSN